MENASLGTSKKFFSSFHKAKSLVSANFKAPSGQEKFDEINIVRLYQGVMDKATESMDSFDYRLWDYNG